MDFFQAALLGIIQGFTEWLPISSSGHLVLAQNFLGLSVPPEFDVVIMLGTIAALAIYFRQKLVKLVLGTLKLEHEQIRYLFLIVLAGIPTALVGFGGKSFFKSMFANPLLVSVLIFVTGVFLFFASQAKEKTRSMGAAQALLVGVAQGLAVAPGISRSGSTIGTALLLGVNRVQAAEFSFIIGIPAMLIASLLELKEVQAAGLDPALLFTGILFAFLAGYASIGFFMDVLKRGKIVWFAYYCLLVGLAFSILFFLNGGVFVV